MSNMLNIVLFGPPGAGKGTQSQKLIDKYGLVHLSTGDILRSEIARGTALGMEAKQIMDRGDLVSDDIVIGMIESKLDAESNAKGFIFDGFPRTQAQAVALDDLLQKKGTAISAMLALEVDNEELVKRLLLRGQESGRPDDQNEEIIRNRVNEYNNKTLPLKKYYSEQAKFHSIKGIGSIDSIFNELCNRITFVNAEIELTELENDIEHLDLTINDFEVVTEISPELQKDIEDVRKETSASSVAAAASKEKPKGIIATIKEKVSNFFHSDKASTTSAGSASPAAKSVKKSGSGKIAKAAPKKATAKATVKKATPKKAVKKSAPKKSAKKVTKKVAPKKVASRTSATTKKGAPKKAVKKVASKKVAPKKTVKKSAPKKATLKKVVKKAAKKAAPKKAVKKVASRASATVKKAVKAVKKAAPKKVIQKAVKKVVKKVASRASATSKKAAKKKK